MRRLARHLLSRDVLLELLLLHIRSNLLLVHVHSHLSHLNIHDSLVLSHLDLVLDTAVTARDANTNAEAYTTSDHSNEEQCVVSNSVDSS